MQTCENCQMLTRSLPLCLSAWSQRLDKIDKLLVMTQHEVYSTACWGGTPPSLFKCKDAVLLS